MWSLNMTKRTLNHGTEPTKLWVLWFLNWLDLLFMMIQSVRWFIKDSTKSRIGIVWAMIMDCISTFLMLTSQLVFPNEAQKDYGLEVDYKDLEYGEAYTIMAYIFLFIMQLYDVKKSREYASCAKYLPN